MKDLTLVDIIKVNKYFEQTSLASINKDALLFKINTGKNKYDFLELLKYMIDYISNSLIERKPVTNNKLKKYIHIINNLFEGCDSNNLLISDDITSKANSLEELYINNRSLTGKDGDGSLIDLLEETKKLATIAYFAKHDISGSFHNEEEIVDEIPTVIEDEDTVIEEYEALVSKLKDRNDRLETELKEHRDAISIASKQSIKDGKDIKKLSQKVDELKDDLKTTRKSIKRLEKDIQDKDKQATKYLAKIEQLNRLIDEYALKINAYNVQVTSLYLENESLHEEVNNKEEIIKSLNDKEKKTDLIIASSTKEEMIDNFIIEQLFTKKMTITSILHALLKTGMDVTKEEVISSLERVKKVINVGPVIGFDKKYGIVEPPYHTNAIFNFPNHSKHFDVVLLADYHYDAGDTTTFLIEKLNSVYDYCVTNKIKNIITLGDLIDNKNIPDGLSKENFEIVKNFLNDFDKILPYDVGIKHYILGGNHDRGFLKYGIDPIEKLTFAREDTVFLGYSNAYIFFGGADIIGLHHEGVPRESIVPNIIESGEETKEYLKKVYENAHINYSEGYLDLFGHFHKSRLDLLNGYGVVPSLNADRNTDGAWHLSFDLDSSGRINYIVINSLSFRKEKELRVNNETVYKKVKK